MTSGLREGEAETVTLDITITEKAIRSEHPLALQIENAPLAVPGIVDRVMVRIAGIAAGFVGAPPLLLAIDFALVPVPYSGRVFYVLLAMAVGYRVALPLCDRVSRFGVDRAAL